MNTDKLKYFIDSAELESFSAAANKNYLSQTAISKQIHALEKDLDVQLFNIEHNSIKLTPAGTLFYHKAKLLLSDLSIAIDQTKQLSRSTSATLRIGFTTSFESIVADELLIPFQKQQPQINLFPVQQTYQQSREGLLNQTIDVVFAIDYGIGHLLSEAYIDRTVAREGEMMIGISKNHPLAQKQVLDGQELSTETIGFYNFDGATPAPNGMIPNAHRDGYAIEKTKRFERLEELLLNVSLNNCITFLPEGFTYPSNPNIVYRKIKNTSHRYQICVVINELNTNPALADFEKLLKQTVVDD